MRQKIGTVEAMHEESRRLAERLRAQENRATVLALYGDLGAGKTTFMQGLAKAFGVKEAVTSPTFVLQKIYKLKNQKFSSLVHIDAYRLETPDEASHLGWDDLVADPGALVCVEWADKLGTVIPRSAHCVKFKFIDENTREIEWMA